VNIQFLFNQIKAKESYLCVGLDTDIHKIPQHLLQHSDPIFEFNKRIIDATKDLCIAYKPNIAFYESLGARGWESLRKTLEYIPEEIFVIADAKRGDIGNTSKLYARAFFENLRTDAITVSPYMGEDSVKPFLDFPEKFVILLGLTSNPGSNDFQRMKMESGNMLFEEVLMKSQQWGGPHKIMYVIGATQPQFISKVREICPDHFLLIPGIGVQGGSLKEISEIGMNSKVGLIVAVSRSIIYASAGENFALKARLEAKKLQEEMAHYLSLHFKNYR
jgi:orotidine-5'-phosphate decarboxylase